MTTKEEQQFDAKITREGKETVFTLKDGREFRVTATSGQVAVDAFLEWKKANA